MDLGTEKVLLVSLVDSEGNFLLVDINDSLGRMAEETGQELMTL